MDRELSLRKLPFRRQQVPLPVSYKDIDLDCGYCLDLLVDGLIIVELKAVNNSEPIHKAQLLNYLKLSHLKLGLLINFNVPLIRNGIKRMAYGL